MIPDVVLTYIYMYVYMYVCMLVCVYVYKHICLTLTNDVMSTITQYNGYTAVL